MDNLLKSSTNRLITVLKRFPLAIACSSLTTILIIYFINLENYIDPAAQDDLAQAVMVSALGFPLFLIIRLIYERRDDIKPLQLISIRILTVILLFLAYFFLLPELTFLTLTRYIAISLALYLIFLLVPYFYKRGNFELYAVKVFYNLLIAGIYAAVLLAGILIIIFTLNQLLNLPATEYIYASVGLLILGFFTPTFFLNKIPQAYQEIKVDEYPDLLKKLVNFIVMPLLTIYTLILYIYFIQILFIWQWPEGLVAHLVLWYASLSFIIIFLISPFKSENKWVERFTYWLPKALIPLLLMMFVAIWIRINTYGVTENRYFVVVLGLWNIAMALYYILVKKKNNLILPMALAILMILAVTGPWSSYSISIYSQSNRFEDIVSKYEMINNNTLIETEKIIARDDQDEIEAILRYFDNYHQLEDLKYLPAEFEIADTEEFFGFTYND